MDAITDFHVATVALRVASSPIIELLKAFRPMEHGRSRLHFDKESKLVHGFDLQLDEEARLAPVKTSRVLEYAEATSALLPERTGPCRDPMSYPDRLQKTIGIFFTQDFDSKMRDDAFGLSPDSHIRRVRDSACSSRGFHGMSNQWRHSSPEAWFEAPSCLVSNGNPQGMMIAIKKAFVLEKPDHNLCLLVSSETHAAPTLFGMPRVEEKDQEASNRVHESFEEFCRDFEQLQEYYQPTLREAKSCIRKKQILLLWFCHAQTLQYLRQISGTRELYLERNETRIDARKSDLLPDLVDEVITEASLFREIKNLADDFTSALESLLQVISIYYDDVSTDGPHKLESIEADVRGLLADLGRTASEVPDTLAHHLKYLELRRNVQDSSGIWVLTVIASLFLPLSLACGILSMSTRLKDLHLLLYDFCGVTVLVVTLMVLLVLIVKACMLASERLKTSISTRNPQVKKGLIIVFVLIVLQSWGAVIASFVVGMIKDVRVGGIILGSATAYFTASATVIFLFACKWALQRLFTESLYQ